MSLCNIFPPKKLLMLTNCIILAISWRDTLRSLGILFRPFTNSVHATKTRKWCSGGYGHDGYDGLDFFGQFPWNKYNRSYLQSSQPHSTSLSTPHYATWLIANLWVGLLIAHPHLLVQATIERFLPAWAIFSADLQPTHTYRCLPPTNGEYQHWLQPVALTS